ncbi:MAG TPA: lipopolysaccharide kinase InaA family protein [Gemmataceae bacterium]|nr:lipopolysaccharide kinase InaA family protein [Gemmataceae bacterium]
MIGSFWQRLLRGVRRTQQRSDWPEFAGADWADTIMQIDVTDDFHAKQGRSTGRWILHEGNRQLSVYLKRHYRLPRLHGLLATLWPRKAWSPALQEASHLEWAKEHGLPVPAVVAAGETIGPWGKLQSFLAVEELVGMLPLHLAIPLAAKQLEPHDFVRWKRGLIAEMARLARELHLRRCFHKDLYLCHFYIPRALTEMEPKSWHGRMSMIDLHRLGHHPLTWRLWQVKDLAELLYSSEVVGVTARDRIQFWREYCGLAPRLHAFWLRRLVLLKWRRYRRHNQKKKVGRPSQAVQA